MIIQAVAMSLVMLVGVGDEPKDRNESTLTRWSQSEPIVGTAIVVDEQGVKLRIDDEIIPIDIPWFDVRELNPQNTESVKNHQAAQLAWRAHSRLARGDYPGAESIYIELAEQYLWKVGPQSADVSIGLVRCRLDRSDYVNAVLPMLSWMVAAGVQSSKSSVELDGFDAQYGVLVDLPPVIGIGDQLAALNALPDTPAMIDRQRVLYGYYQLALDTPSHRTALAQAELDRLDDMLRGRESRDAGVDLFEDMVVAQAHPDDGKRAAARNALERRIRSNTNTWIEIWSRLGIGVSLLAEKNTESNEQGVIELIHIVVRLELVNHQLAVAASQIANEYLVRTDRTQWGAELMLQAQSAWSNETPGN